MNKENKNYYIEEKYHSNIDGGILSLIFCFLSVIALSYLLVLDLKTFISIKGLTFVAIFLIINTVLWLIDAMLKFSETEMRRIKIKKEELKDETS